jgi:hypothetical protein
MSLFEEIECISEGGDGAGFPRREALQLRGLDLFLREVAQRRVCPICDHAAE